MIYCVIRETECGQVLVGDFAGMGARDRAYKCMMLDMDYWFTCHPDLSGWSWKIQVKNH